MADDGSEIIGGVGVTVTGDYSDLADSFTSAQADAQAAGESIAEAFNTGAEGTNELTISAEGLNAALGDLDGTAEKTGFNVGELGKSLLEIAGIGISIGALKEFAGASLEIFAATEKAEIALTAMTGSAEGAAQSISGLKQMAMSLALPFESLVQADQRLTAFGLTAKEIKPVLEAAADAAAATGNSFDTVAMMIGRMGVAGMAGGRQLAQLGITTKELADAMGVSVGEMQKDFKALDEQTRFEVVTAALEKFHGTAQKVAESTSGTWQRLKTETGLVMEDIGKAIAPVASALADLATKFLGVFHAVDEGKEKWRLLNDSIDVLQVTAHRAGIDFSALQKSFQDALIGPDEYKEKLAALIQKYNELHPAAAGAADDSLKGRVAAQLHAQGLGEAAEAVDKFKRSLPPMSNEVQVLAEREKEAQATHQAFVKEVADSGLTWEQYGAKLHAATLAADGIRQAFFDSAAAMAPIPGESLKAAQQIDFLDKQIGTMNTSLAASESAWLDLSNGMGTAGLNVKNLGSYFTEAKKSTEAWTHETGLVDKAFTTLGQHITQSIFQAKTFGDVWKGVLKSVGEEGVSELINWLMKLAAKQVEQLLVTKAATSTEDVAQVAGAAAVGGANVAAWTASIPFVGPGLAPAAGMAEYAAIMGQFGPLASFAKGIDYVPYDMVAQIHQGEKITPASENTGSGSGHTFNFYGTISGVTKETITQVATQMVRQLRLGNARI